jgi:hypothetical protein
MKARAEVVVEPEAFAVLESSLYESNLRFTELTGKIWW